MSRGNERKLTSSHLPNLLSSDFTSLMTASDRRQTERQQTKLHVAVVYVDHSRYFEVVGHASVFTTEHKSLTVPVHPRLRLA